MLVESQSRPSYKPSPDVAHVLWIYLATLQRRRNEWWILNLSSKRESQVPSFVCTKSQHLFRRTMNSSSWKEEAHIALDGTHICSSCEIWCQTYQWRWRREWRPSLSVISAAFMALGRSCLLAKTRRTASRSSSCSNPSKKLDLSTLNTGAILPRLWLQHHSQTRQHCMSTTSLTSWKLKHILLGIKSPPYLQY